MEIKSKKIIVTGGAGFIGSNLVERLAGSGNEVIVIDKMHTGSPENLKRAQKSGRVRLIQDDVRSIEKMTEKVDLVFHLGFPSATPMYKENRHLMSDAIDGMISVLEYCKINGCMLVFSSTSSMYSGVTPPQREDALPPIFDFYTEARIACERIAEVYTQLYGMDVVGLRFFSVYGTNERAKKGYANLVTQFYWDIKAGRQPLIFGDGEQRRDFTFVADIVDALLLSTRIKGFNIFNVGTGVNYSLNEMVAIMNRKLGTDIRPKYAPIPIKNYVSVTLADTTKAEKVLGFKAKYSLEQGIDELMKEE